MAAPAAVLAVKAAALAASDQRVRTAAVSVIAALLTPFLLIVVVLLRTLSGTADHNNSAVQLSFHGGYLSSQMPAEYRLYIKKMQESFTELDAVLTDVNAMCEDEAVDGYRVKAIFYALFFGVEQPRMDAEDYQTFVDCFVTYEEREDGEGESDTVAVSIASMETVYANLASELGRTIALEEKTNVQRIYSLAKYGRSASGGNGLMPGAAMGDGSFSALMAEATKYIGWPYVWGGSSPATSFDCSGFICWSYTQSGVYHLPRTTAQGIFDRCAVVSWEEARPGDLIFFTGTYASGSPVSHVGIYVGDNQMLHAGSPIGYANISSAYWSGHYYATGRLAGIPE